MARLSPDLFLYCLLWSRQHRESCVPGRCTQGTQKVRVQAWAFSLGTGKLGFEPAVSLRGLGTAGQELTCDSGAGPSRPHWLGLPLWTRGKGATGINFQGWEARCGAISGVRESPALALPGWATWESFRTSPCLSFPISWTIRGGLAGDNLFRAWPGPGCSGP